MTNRMKEALDAAIAGLDASASNMPASPYRELYRWALRSDNGCQGDWLQLIGMHGLIRLAAGLLEGAVDDAQWTKLVPYTIAISVQQVYEVVSDNLAIGLASRADDDASFATRRELLLHFNNAMIRRLRGASSTETELAPAEPLLSGVSLFTQSLSPQKHRAIVERFLAARPEIASQDLEYSLRPNLFANLDTTVAVADVLNVNPVAGLVREGLIGRYAGVSKLLDEPEMRLEDRLATSAHTIMVIPTIAYYVGALAEVVEHWRGFDALVADGTLYDALHDAALLVRLLNDVGTNLLRQPETERAALFQSLRARAERSPDGSLYALLRDSLDEHKSLFTRIRKDVLMREFNVCMQSPLQPTREALPQFESDLVVIKRLYAERKAGLGPKLATIRDRLGSETVSRVVDRFVGFHELLYTRAYDDPMGEYAV